MKQAKKADESLYIPLSEVAKTLKIKPHILYYWEKKFPQLKPYRIAQRKFYKKEQLDLLQKIKALLEEGYTLDGIKKILQTHKKSSEPQQKSLKASESEKDLKKVLHEVLEELKLIYQQL
jgi:DNA-binding transcriptional MerR regulator